MKQRGRQIRHKIISYALCKEIIQRSMLQADTLNENPVLGMLKTSLLEGCGGFGEIHMRRIQIFKTRTLFSVRCLQVTLLHRALRVRTSRLHT
jgi:hypothetical protein